MLLLPVVGDRVEDGGEAGAGFGFEFAKFVRREGVELESALGERVAEAEALLELLECFAVGWGGCVEFCSRRDRHLSSPFSSCGGAAKIGRG